MKECALRIGVTRETRDGETRVSGTPATVRQLIGLGYEVVVETGAGNRSSFTDEAYVEAGASIGDAWGADIIFKVNPPGDNEIGLLRQGSTLIGLLSPALNPELVDTLAARPITALALDAVPRISRAQSMDVLSSMANIAGYRAVIEAAHAFGRFFTGQVTAAGKVPPAKVLVAGTGVAGLAAIGAANSLGAIVRATDPRPEVADQVKSLGGEYLHVDVEQEVSTDGYAKATSEAYDRRAAEIYTEQAAEVDIIITTALIPGRPAPKLITAADVASMQPGSVIVDMAAQQGGNVAGSRAGEIVTTPNGVTIIGYTDLAGRLPAQASQLYGTNLVNLMKLLTPAKDGQLVLDFDDVVQRSITVVRDGEKTWPPPPVQVSAAAAAPVPAPARAVVPEKKPIRTGRMYTAGRHRHRCSVPADRILAEPADEQLLGLRAGRGHRLLRHRQGAPCPAHPADVGYERDLRDHHRRRVAPDWTGQPAGDHPRLRRGPARGHQHLRRFQRHPPYARHVFEGARSTNPCQCRGGREGLSR